MKPRFTVASQGAHTLEYLKNMPIRGVIRPPLMQWLQFYVRGELLYRCDDCDARGLQGVTRMAYSPRLWLMAIGW